MRAKLAPRNFAAGELAPWMDGLYTELTQKGARRLENFIVKKQGAIVRRPGTYYVDECRDLLDHGDCESTDAPHIIGDGASVVNCTFARSNEQAHAGTYSYKLIKTSAAGATHANARLTDSCSTTDLHELVAGKIYKFSSYVYLPTASGAPVSEIHLIIGYYDSGAWTYNQEICSPVLDAWSYIETAEITIPATATAIIIYFQLYKTAAINEYFYVDDIHLECITDHPILIPCEIDSDNIYVLEVDNEYIRFYDAPNHVQVSSAAAAYEVSSPWSLGELTDLRWCYVPNEKAICFTHPKHPIQKLKWTSDSSWEIQDLFIHANFPLLMTNYLGQIAKSEDAGETWEFDRIDALQSAVLAAHGIIRNKNVYLAADYNSGVASSEDGLFWTRVKNQKASNQMPGIAANGSRDVCLCGMNGDISYSEDDGVTWQTAPSKTSVADFRAIGFDKIEGYWRTEAISLAMWCSDLNSWTTMAPLGHNPKRIQGHSGLWVCGYENGIGSAASIAAPMTLRLSLVGYHFRGIARGTPGETALWVAAGTQGTAQRIYNSPDGTTWSLALSLSYTKSGTRREIDVAWLGHNFIVCCDMFDSDYMMSADGVSWTTHTMTNCYTKGSGFLTREIDAAAESFSAEDHYPKNITYHEGRSVVGPTEDKPATLWASKTSKLQNFYIGIDADEAWSYDLASDRNVDIQWVMGGNDLVVGTRTAEGVMRGGPDAGITPSAARFLWQSTFGSANIQPIRVGNMIIFVQRGGEIIRGYIPEAGTDAYQSPDLTAFADHIAAGGITEIDHQDDPQTIIWFVRDDGELLALTFEGQTLAWSRMTTGASGEFESIAIVPTDGAEDEIWAVVKRTINGSTVRYIEYFDTLSVVSKNYAHFVDSGVHMSSASAITEVTGLTHLHAEYVDVCIDGHIVEKTIVVTSTGTAALSFSTGLHVHAGLPYISYGQTMRMETGSQFGSGMGLSKRGRGKLFVWVHETIGGEYGPDISITEAVSYSATSDLTTAMHEIDFPGDWNRDAYLWVIQQDPLPMTVVGYAPDVVVGDR